MSSPDVSRDRAAPAGAQDCGLLLAAMFCGVVLTGFLGMMGSMHVVPMGEVGMMPRLFMVPGLVMLCGLAVMARGMLVVLSGFVVVVCSGMTRHKGPSFLL